LVLRHSFHFCRPAADFKREGNSFAGPRHFAVKTFGLKPRGGFISLKFSSPAVAR
jgi:hypothetical protein